jgi:DNA repair exonuclease SbcCD nuclease subunit
MNPYILISDTHYHDWQQFASIGENGVNSRLQIQLDATKEAVDRTPTLDLIHAGDFFHVRGKITPSVMNPVIDMYSEFSKSHHREIGIIAGNHDLGSSDTCWLENSSQPLQQLGENVCIVSSGPRIDEQGKIVLFPWREKLDQLREDLLAFAAFVGNPAEYDAIIHAPVNGVIKGIPDNGFTPEELESYGFKRVFAGHYHSHKQLSKNVWSVGALTHQTWSDIGSEAGYCIVYPDRVEHFKTKAPKFVLDGDNIVGNYVKVRTTETNAAKLKEAKRELIEAGAAGVLFEIQMEAVATRKDAIEVKLDGLEESIRSYSKDKYSESATEFSLMCLNEIAEVI